MKKLFFPLLIIALSIVSCKKEVKEKEVEKAISQYNLNAESISLEWTAFKTSDKVPVKGTFTKIDLKNSPIGGNPVEVIENLKFSIPVNTIFTKDTIRDGKLKKFLFGNMMNTSTIDGEVSLNDDGTGEALISMNGMEKSVPVNYEVNGEDIKITAAFDLNNWQAQAALEALNQACFELHKGPDGVSKTWSNVEILVNVKTQLTP